jgi:hypothetical protein
VLNAAPHYFEEMLQSGGVLQTLDEAAEGHYSLIGGLPDDT